MSEIDAPGAGASTTRPPQAPLDLATGFWLEQGGGVLPTSGRSMSPTFEEAAKVWIERGPRARFGDVLVYRSAALLVVHRVVSVVPGRSFRTKGDGLPHLDRERVTADLVLGRVVEIERAGARYRTDRMGGTIYARTVATVSAVEGFAYRVAWRLDQAIGAVRRERMVFRAAVSRGGRFSLGLIDRCLFRLLNTRIPGHPVV